MHVQVMTVTPDMAREWLNRNGKNRNMSRAHAEKIADSICRGKWVLNGETICFDQNGLLLDGQHRLMGVVISGLSIEVAVATGVSDPSAFETYDSVQRIRGANQIAAMKGVKNSTRVTAIARVVFAWEQSATLEEFYSQIVNPRPTITPQELSDVAVKIQEESDFATDLVGYSFVRQSGAGSHLVAMAVILNRIDPVTTSSLFERVRTGIVQSQKDPALVFRDRLLSGRAKGMTERKWKASVAAFTVKAWNCEKSGRPMQTLWFRQDGESPEKFPAPIGGGKK